MNSEVNVR